ncbi:hypothetical protein LCGC14_2434480 [marine sediment metagenome]|uniref:Uncharacterized protein n=1 Tax=marine sediment metagenome TaxID=412755 RepID=A0A0F9BL20_9ZZZZ
MKPPISPYPRRHFILSPAHGHSYTQASMVKEDYRVGVYFRNGLTSTYIHREDIPARARVTIRYGHRHLTFTERKP